MTQRRRGLKGAFSAALPEKRLFIQSERGARYIRISSRAQWLTITLAVATVGWLAFSTADFAVDMIAADADAGQGLDIGEAYRARLEALTEERDQRAAETQSAQARFQTAMQQISRQQSALLQEVEQRRELSSALDMMRERLAQTVSQRDAVSESNDRLLARMNEVSDAIESGGSGEDLTATLKIVTSALSEAVVARDTASAERETLAAELAQTERELRVTVRRQDEMLAQLKDAVAESKGSLEGLLAKASLDVDSVLAATRQQYSGQGGPLVPLGVSTRSYDDGAAATASPFDELMIDIDRMNLLRIAIGKVPYAVPVRDAFRFTSGFGYRSDPKGRGRRMHAGVDFAAPSGTPIYATADGVVTTAASESGYGRVVRIQHEFGFETVYAHQTRLLVKQGQRVSRGDHIGDMGATGRVTGVHLHYEVRLNGQPVNPMTYVEAAKDVF